MLDRLPREIRQRQRVTRRWLRVFWRISKWTLLLAATIGVGVGCWKFFGWQQQRHARAFLREALRAERENRPNDAIAALRGCIQLAPDELRAYCLWATLLRREEQLPAADECLERMVAANPRDGRAYTWRARHLLETGRAAAAEADLDRALALAPHDRDVLLLAAEYWLARKKPELAEEYAVRLQKTFGGHAAVASRLGALELMLGRRAEAIAAYRRAFDADVKNPQLLFSLVDLLCADGQFNEVRSLLTRAAAWEWETPIVPLLEARAVHAQGRWQETLWRLERIQLGSAVPADQVRQRYAWEGDCHARMGNVPAQLAAWRKAVQADPQYLPLRRQLIEALVLAGRSDEALAEARALKAQSGGSPDDDLHLAHLLIGAARRLPAEQRKWEEPATLIAAARAAQPQSLAADLLRAELLLAQDRAAAAAEVFPPPAGKWPRRIECWLARAWIAASQDDPAGAFGWVENAKQVLGDSLAWRRAAAAYVLWQLGPGAAPQLRALGEDLAKLAPAERPELLAALTWACVRVGDGAAAVKFAADLAALKSDDPVHWLLQFEVALRGNRTGGLERLLKQVKDAEGEGPHWNYGKAVHLFLLARGGQPHFFSDAAGHAARACRLAPGWSCAPLLAAEIEAAERHVSVACAYYVQAVFLGEARPVVLRQLFDYLDAQQQYLKIDQALRRLGTMAAPLLTTPVGRAFTVTLPGDESSYARRAAAQAVQQASSAANLVWLARLLEIAALQPYTAAPRAAAFRELTEELLRKAVAAEPGSASARAALVQFYFRGGQTAKARAALDAAPGKIPARQLLCLQADGEQLLGNHREAERLWRQALVSGPDATGRVRALEYLQLVGGADRVCSELEAALVADPPPGDDDRIAIRRRLAWELTSSGSAEDRQRADRLLAENLAEQPGNVLDQQLRAVVLATGAKKGWRRAAIDVLEGLAVVDWRRLPDQKFFLAQLCLAEGDLPRARRHLGELVAWLPNEPRYVVALVETLAQSGAVQEARQHAARLEALAPEAFLTLSAQSDVAVAEKRAAEVPAMVQRFLVRPDRQPADPVVCLELVSQCLQRLAERCSASQGAAAAAPLLKTAAALREELIDRAPQAALRWAGRQSRSGHFEAALATVKKVVARVPTEPLAQTLAVLAAAAKAPAQQAAFETFLTAALETQKRPPALVAAAAVFYAERRQYDRAEAALREVIGKSPSHPTALNNLALQLALSRRNLDEALELIERAIQLAGPRPGLLDTRAVVHTARGEIDEALADLEQAITAGPRSTWFFHKARALEARKDLAGAAKADAQARELGLDTQLLHPLERPVAKTLPASASQ